MDPQHFARGTLTPHHRHQCATGAARSKVQSFKDKIEIHHTVIHTRNSNTIIQSWFNIISCSTKNAITWYICTATDEYCKCKNAIVSKMTYNTLHNQMWCILFPISKLSKTHAHTMDNLSKVLCMCQNPFDTRKFTSLVPNWYFFLSLPGQTCCFRGVNNFYVKLTKQFTKKFEFTIIHFPCPVKCTNHLPQDPGILYIWCCANPWIEREGVWHPSDNVCLLDLDFDPSQLLNVFGQAVPTYWKSPDWKQKRGAAEMHITHNNGGGWGHNSENLELILSQYHPWVII